MLVFDCSVTLAWFLKDEGSPFTEASLDLLAAAECWVPALWRLEFANALLAAQRRGRLGREERLEALDAAAQLALRVDAAVADLRGISQLAERRGLSAYDAAYLELALRRGFELVTLDRALGEAAAAEGLVVHAPGRASAAQMRRRYEAAGPGAPRPHTIGSSRVTRRNQT